MGRLPYGAEVDDPEIEMRALVGCLFLVACSAGADKSSTPEGGSGSGADDTAASSETDRPDDGADTGGDSADTADSGDTADTDATEDTGTDQTWPLEGAGTLTGSCGDILTPAILADPTPLLLQTELDLGAEGFDPDTLSEGGTEIWTDGNLGGSSAESEVVAYEVLYRCEAATLLKTEGEIVYRDPGGKKTDFLVELDGTRVGVSVTRAVGWPREDPYTTEQATDLLADKLGDIPLSSANVAEEDAWSRQILSVIAYEPGHATSIESAWDLLTPEVRGDTILFVTATLGEDDALY